MCTPRRATSSCEHRTHSAATTAICIADPNSPRPRRFEFFAKNHTLTQSSFDAPCTKQANHFGEHTGIDSAFNFPSESTDGRHQPAFAFSVEDDSKPLWFYCRQTGPKSHCNDGMVVSTTAVRLDHQLWLITVV